MSTEDWGLLLSLLRVEGAALTDSLRIRFGSGPIDALLSSHFLREAEPSTIALCDSCADPHSEPVEYVDLGAGTRPFVRCPEAGLCRLEPSDLRRWIVDGGSVAAAAARAIGCDGEVETIVTDRLWRVGRVPTNESVEVFLLRGLSWPDASSVWKAAERAFLTRSPLVLVPEEEVPSTQRTADGVEIRRLADVFSLSGTELQARGDIGGRARGRQPGSGDASGSKGLFPPGARWEELRAIVTDLAVNLECRGIKRVLKWDAFVKGTDIRKVLTGLACSRGSLSLAHGRKNSPAARQRIVRLRKRLQAAIGLTGNPIRHNRKTNVYESAFIISMSGLPRMPVPAGATWRTALIEEVEGKRIRFTFGGHEAIQGYETRRDGGREPTSGILPIEDANTFSLDDLQMAIAGGRPTRVGSVFLKILRAGGTLAANPDSPETLILSELNAALREIAGLDEDALTYNNQKGAWITAFQTATQKLRDVSRGS
jgi:hypothetical protein